LTSHGSALASSLYRRDCYLLVAHPIEGWDQTPADHHRPTDGFWSQSGRRHRRRPL